MGGLALVWRCAWQSIPLVVLPRFETAAVHRAIAAWGITHLSLVPTALQKAIAAADFAQWHPHWQNLRAILVGGGPIPQPLVAQCLALGLPMAPTYGLTEAASQVATLPPSAVATRPQSVGRPLPGLTLTVRDDQGQALPPSAIGEIWLEGSRLSAACPQPYPTGDLGYLDPDGYLYIVNRRADLIVSGGENIYPREVEQALEPHCQAVCVVPRPDPLWGQVPVAVVVPGDRPYPSSPPKPCAKAPVWPATNFPKICTWCPACPCCPTAKLIAAPCAGGLSPHPSLRLPKARASVGKTLVSVGVGPACRLRAGWAVAVPQIPPPIAPE
ncbi:MAG: 2-succinylbenzoate--CoA ligase [Oscillatoriales cyanobacterium SM2_1_8]|nr:2-succinylbenzoate--CoA ligase [Oscillatoriales cyanobacterium SM2_1_8]